MTNFRTPVLNVVLVMALTCAPAGAQVYLAADFDDKVVDAPIGTGGPTVGEPTYVMGGVVATVRATPLPTPSLELVDDDDSWDG